MRIEPNRSSGHEDKYIYQDKRKVIDSGVHCCGVSLTLGYLIGPLLEYSFSR